MRHEVQKFCKKSSVRDSPAQIFCIQLFQMLQITSAKLICPFLTSKLWNQKFRIFENLREFTRKTAKPAPVRISRAGCCAGPAGSSDDTTITTPELLPPSFILIWGAYSVLGGWRLGGCIPLRSLPLCQQGMSAISFRKDRLHFLSFFFFYIFFIRNKIAFRHAALDN